MRDIKEREKVERAAFNDLSADAKKASPKSRWWWAKGLSGSTIHPMPAQPTEPVVNPNPNRVTPTVGQHA